LQLGTGAAARATDVTALVKPDQTYALDFWTHRSKSDTATATVGISFYSGSTSLGSFERNIEATSWTRTRLSFVPPIGFDRAIVWASKGADTSLLYVDDI